MPVKLPGSLTMDERLLPMPVDITIRDLLRFWKFVDRGGGPDACWLWTGAIHTHADAYGSVYERRGRFTFMRRSYMAPRVAYYFEHRVDPGENYVLHSCDNPLCVNPKHLSLGSQGDNMREAYARGRRTNRGSNSPAAILTEQDIPMIRKRREAGEMLRVIAQSYGVSIDTISLIANGKTWRHVR